ncbi:50S ribosomal protein L24 [Candidatus Daviesbacteria bacterium RIFCSPHIGHO2_01_FULL_44_29]|uniref:Large ribosomal subunit protein uL24 n=1 Tax=Candidatus Daviesbacteria bacterium RIFCSPHIGHO2_02_FULL_43_12 TaxID=1797776 RepID=A0A1F5KGM0_9BACT|nr:MAG: 50S ribosomal protein L24 [Candidatus Daviesbacteria bacterium RIFCSPHIGHO2_01_FULL_44_29]OGE39945.1 MAG: 50S ribosomal protein L24 [Candidatus Daviesbacteria bacterium RIFCSPHIGHO2_02_FULL_43_12]OGE40498.1 MAG: 50S ribosomal protein L24 [Candidatus Daviesbacteria bacterium RIFCSPHIGHO2_12_FULL_47_45]OGE70374.1 MAG: 50S ribosomal protein L24 [Candidatus Daviesbacteria bacterium RIFCSPLOWO2_01_FULL_43_15]
MNKLRKGDKVKIMVGKDNGRDGVVERVSIKEGKVFITGMNIAKRHVKATQGMEGGIIEITKPLNIANVALICPNCGKPARIGFSFADHKKGSPQKAVGKVRICKKCKKEIS